MPVKEISTNEDFAATIGSVKLVLVDFYADWCGPCRRFESILNKICDEFETKIDVAKVNVDKLDKVTKDQKITCMPTFVFYKNGERLVKIEGASEHKVRGAIDKLLN